MFTDLRTTESPKGQPSSLSRRPNEHTEGEMRHTWPAVACAIGMALGAVGIGQAHHGTAAYGETTVTVSGVVTEFKFVNPHVLVLWDVKDESGALQHWSGERSGPNSMARERGW